MKAVKKPVWAAVVSGIILFASTAAPARSQDPFREAPPEVEEALRARIQKFYEYFQQGKFRQAEQLVLEESRDHFYNAKKSRIFGFEIRNIKFSGDLTEASVLVSCMTLVPGLGSKPFPVPLPSAWKALDGEWYLFFQTRPEGEAYNSPAGKMHFDRNAPRAGELGSFQQTTLESLRGMYYAEPTRMEFSSRATEPVTKTFRVENRSKGILTLETDSKGMPGVTIDLGAGEFAPGEAITVSVTYVPHELLGVGEFKLHFVVQPILQAFEVTLDIN